MDVKRLKAKHGAINGKLMAMVHSRTDVAAIETFFSEIGAELALIICQSLRGCYTIHTIGAAGAAVTSVKNRKWYAEILFWLIACYNNPMFAKTYHIGWKYGGYEEDSLAVRSQRGRRNRSEMIRFLDHYTLKTFEGGWNRLLPNSKWSFSFMGVEPSYYWVCTEDPLVFTVSWATVNGDLKNRYPYPTTISTNASKWTRTLSYELSAEYYDEDGHKIIILREFLSSEHVQKIFNANFHIKSIEDFFYGDV